MTRHPIRAVLVAALLVGVAVGAPTPAAAESYPSNCPAMTDSITRLYLGYFGRDPEPNGFGHWVSLYKTGQMSLEEISDEFAKSPEFVAKNLISDESYTIWLYNQVLQRPPTSEELDHWVRALGGGYPRGSVMLTLSESREFVEWTETDVPLAGYLRWYPRGTHWYCNVGPQALAVNPLVGDVWADYYFSNRGENAQDVLLWTLNGSQQREVRMVNTTLPGGFTDYNWDGVFSGDGDYGSFIEVSVGSSIHWIVVFYPRSIGEARLGWQLAS